MPADTDVQSESPYSEPATTESRRSPWWDLVRALGLLALIAFCGIILYIIVLMFAYLRDGRSVPNERYWMHRSTKKMEQITFALRQYAADYGQFPPAFTKDSEGKPLHSWRTLILPYLGERELYSKIDFTKPWDDPVNLAIAKMIPELYRCDTANIDETLTTIVAVVGSDTAIRADSSLQSSEIRDNERETILIVEMPVQHAVEWMSPKDVSPESLLASSTFKQPQHPDVVVVGMADGSVRTIPSNMDPRLLRSLSTVVASEPVPDKPD